jgi:hypothetical protein
MNLHQMASIAGISLALWWSPAPAQNTQVIETTENRVERTLFNDIPGYKIGENIALFSEVANPNLLLDPSITAMYADLLTKSWAQQLSIYAFDQSASRTKKWVGYVIKVDFIKWNTESSSVFYFVTSRPNMVRLASNNLDGALKEAKWI